MEFLRLVLAAVIMVAFSSCYEEFEPEVDQNPVLCVNSLIKVGEPIDLELSQTRMFTSPPMQWSDLSDVSTCFYANGNEVPQDYTPKAGDKIRIIVRHPQYSPAIAETTIPYAVPIYEVKCDVVNLREHEDMPFDLRTIRIFTFDLRIVLTFTDFINSDDYYQFVYSTDEESESCNVGLSLGSFAYESEPIFHEHVSVFDELTGADDNVEFTFFSDRQFRGKSSALNLNFYDNMIAVEDPEYIDCPYLNLVLNTVSESYYRWSIYKWCVDEGITDELADFGFAESKWGYSNVSTGAGVVGACNQSIYKLDLSTFLEPALKERLSLLTKIIQQ